MRDLERALVETIECPRCKFWQDSMGDEPPYQKMCAIRDQPSSKSMEIFCPHCDLQFDLTKVG